MEANRVDDQWDALADGTRRAIVACLANGPRPVGKLADELPVSRSAVSQHLKILKDAGLVEGVAAGTRRIYRLNPVALAALRDGYLVHVASDAVSSRTEWNWKIGLDRMRAAGAVISSTEMMIYELMRSSASEAFKEMLPHLKGSLG